MKGNELRAWGKGQGAKGKGQGSMEKRERTED